MRDASRIRVTEDGVWRYYNCPDRVWSEKCRRCRQIVAETRAPAEECLNCWKVEIWSLESATEQDGLIEALTQMGHKIVAKASRAPILVVRTGDPMDAYPSPEIETANLLMLYAGSEEERDALRRDTEQALGSVRLPIRRGCWRYDSLLGPWEIW